MEKVLKSGRIDYAKRSPYNNGVYNGNWFEDRCKYVKEKHHHISIYMQDYVQQPYSKVDPSVLFDVRSKGDGIGTRLLFNHDGDNYTKNLATTSDLVHHHIPNWCGDKPVRKFWRHRMERWEPEQDYARNYGNITTYGITEYKRQIWEDNKMDLRCPLKSDYQDTFVAPAVEDYKFKRWGIPLSNSSIMNKLNYETLYLKYRNTELNAVPRSEDLVPVARDSRCDPISWKCRNETPNVTRRCVDQKASDSALPNK